jgi:hypothetical protein
MVLLLSTERNPAHLFDLSFEHIIILTLMKFDDSSQYILRLNFSIVWRVPKQTSSLLSLNGSFNGRSEGA